MAPDLYAEIQEWESEGFKSSWADEQCQSAYNKLSREVKVLSVKQVELEERQTEIDKQQEAALVGEELRDNKVTCYEKAIMEIQDMLVKLEAEKSNKAVFRELAERIKKANNVILHMIPESTSREAASRKLHDMQAMWELLEYLVGNMKVDREVKFGRRQGVPSALNGGWYKYC